MTPAVLLTLCVFSSLFIFSTLVAMSSYAQLRRYKRLIWMCEDRQQQLLKLYLKTTRRSDEALIKAAQILAIFQAQKDVPVLPQERELIDICLKDIDDMLNNMSEREERIDNIIQISQDYQARHGIKPEKYNG